MIRFTSDQTARTLTEQRHRFRHLILKKRFSALIPDPLAAGRDHRIIRGRERNTVNHDDRERLALDIDTFPETHRADENRGRILSEFLDKAAPCAVSLTENAKRHPVFIRELLHHVRNDVHGAETRAEEESAAARLFDKGPGAPCDRLRERRRIRFRESLREIKRREAEVIEG